MLVMLCTRCQQREAKSGVPPEKRAKFEAETGTLWPLPDGLCNECVKEWFKSPEGKAQLEPFRRAIWARVRAKLEKYENEVRTAALKVLDVADAIAGRI